MNINGQDVNVGTDADLRKILTDNCGQELADYVVDALVNSAKIEDEYYEMVDDCNGLITVRDDLQYELRNVKNRIEGVVKFFQNEQENINTVLKELKQIADKIDC
jgi:gas vesicle protein